MNFIKSKWWGWLNLAAGISNILQGLFPATFLKQGSIFPPWVHLLTGIMAIGLFALSKLQPKQPKKDAYTKKNPWGDLNG